MAETPISRNVDALKALCRRWDMEVRDRYEFPDSDDLAEFLADEGCLAVDSLTDEQVREVELASYVNVDGTPDRYAPTLNPDFDEAVGRSMRAALRRCATGEPE
jgi:hypothetical protein